MGMVEEVGTYIQAQSLGTLGTSLFLNGWSDSTGIAACLFEYPGSSPRRRYAGVAWEEARIQVVVRSTTPSGPEGIADPRAARVRAQKIWRTLEDIGNENLTAVNEVGSTQTTYYLSVSVLQSPFLLDRDDKGRTLFAFNCRVQRDSS